MPAPTRPRWSLLASLVAALGTLVIPSIVDVSGSGIAIAAPKKKPKKTPKAAPAAKPESAKPDPTTTEPDPSGKPDDSDPAKSIAPTTTTPAPPTTPTGAGAGSAGAAVEPVKPTQPAPADGPDVDTLRQEYLSLRDELFKSRARANAVSSQLYSTRVTIKLTYGSGRYYNANKVSIRLDGASVYDDTTGAIAKDDGVRFDGFVAPGRHLVTFRIEAVGKDDDSFSSTTEAQITVKAVAGKDLIIAAKARDSGDIAYAWKREERGSYGLAIDVGVKTAPGAAKASK